MKTKQNLLLMILMVIFCISGMVQASDLVITGVIDGPLSGGIPKAVELYAINNISNLNNYGIGSANNGGGSDGEEFSFPAVVVQAGSFIYVASESNGFNDFFGFSTRYTSNALAINGDDAIELFKDGEVIDVFGDINVDGSGTDWEYQDGWAYRKNNTQPDGNSFEIANWTFSGPNALDGATTNATADTPFPVGTYVHNSASTAPSITGITQTPEDVTSSDNVTITANITDNGAITSALLLWGTATETYSDTITMVTSDSTIFITENGIPARSHGTTIYYKIKAEDNDGETSTSVEFHYMVLDYDPEPSNHVTNFIATKVGQDKIILSWHDNNGTVAPAGYLIKASTSNTINAPQDGTPMEDNLTIGENTGTVTIPATRINYEWAGLDEATTYYFKIYPYTNSGDLIDYKTDGTVPLDNNTTTASDLVANYYSGTDGLSGDQLKFKLNDIIDNHETYPYSDSRTDVWDMLKLTDQDSLNPNNVILIYSGHSVDAAAEFDNGNGWTREHVWAQSHGDFGTGEGPGTDIHHLRPCNGSVNSSKGNLDFDDGGTAHTIATDCYYDDNSWQVRDIVKGDIARMMFYMDTRYEGENDEVDLELVDYIPSSPNGEPYHGKLSTLLEWHEEDPVDEYERRRNEIIYSFQGNRNPFVDHPEFAMLVWEDVNSIEDLAGQSQVAEYRLNPAYPNPFNPATTIAYEIPAHCQVRLNIYNIKGELVRTLVNTTKSKGIYTIQWRGLNDNFQTVSNGVYFYQLITSTGFTRTSKVVFMK